MKSKELRKNKGEIITAYCMILPAIALLCIFVLVPLIMAVYDSFFETTAHSTSFIGLQYYIKVLKNENFIKSILNVIKFALIITFLQIVLSFLFANVLVRIKGKFGIFARTIIYLPYLLSGVVVSVIFSLLTTYNGGVLNCIIEACNGKPVAWNNDSFWSVVSIVVPTIWIGFGYNALVMYAGLINIPKDYYEAAAMDGAGFWKTTFHISIPCMKNYFVLLIVTMVVGNLQMYEIPMIMTGGQPANKTMVPVLYLMYSRANGNISDSEITAAAILIMIIVLLINSIIFSLFRTKKGEEMVE